MQCDSFSCFTNTQIITIKKKTKPNITSTRILIYLYLFYHTYTLIYQKLNAVPPVRYLVLVPTNGIGVHGGTHGRTEGETDGWIR
jgi:hypothetical protein